MSTAHDRLKAIEARLADRGATRILLDDEIDDIDELRADMAWRAESDRLTQLARLEAEQNTFPTRRHPAEHQEQLF